MELLSRLEARAREVLPGPVYDHVVGGAGDERTVAENLAAWGRVGVRPRVLVDVAHIDTRCRLLGDELALPVLLAPIGALALLHPDGECGTARAAGMAGSALCLSSRATTDLAAVAAAASGPLWFQLYVNRDHGTSRRILARVAEHGYTAVVVTADLPVAGRRERDLRNGDVPLPAGVRVTDHLGGHADWTVKPIAGWDPALTWEDLAWIGEACELPVLVKGLLTADDALRAIDAGAAGVVVSNHGGRQLDGVLPTAMALPEVAAAVAGRAAVLVDGGVRSGTDVLRALALGADAVLVGRPYAFGLAAEGEAGVRAVLDALAEDLRRSMALAGTASLADIGSERVKVSGW